jgi:hypothetical protein
MSSWSREPRVLWRRSLGRVLVALPDSDGFALLEGPAAEAWLELESPVGEAALIERLARRYDVAPTVVTESLLASLEELRAQGALVSR